MPGRRGQYGRTWPRERVQWLKQHPWCATCAALGQQIKATDVDHVMRHHGMSDPLFWDKTNWASKCSLHHKQKSGREAHGLKEKMGCGADGWPIDRDHPWNRA
jgi:5-methylcytosine-specific restriction protein A